MKAIGVRLICVIAGLCGIIGPYGCRAQILRHDQHVAAQQAQSFLEQLVINRDVGSAHAMLADSAKAEITVAVLQDVVSKQHPQGYPDKVWAAEFEPSLDRRSFRSSSRARMHARSSTTVCRCSGPLTRATIPPASIVGAGHIPPLRFVRSSTSVLTGYSPRRRTSGCS
jgi:hypothetical protein